MRHPSSLSTPPPPFSKQATTNASHRTPPNARRPHTTRRPRRTLHLFNVKDGWEPLCKIVNCPIPDEPFPRANDKAAMEEFFLEKVEGFTRWMQIFAANGVAVAIGWWALEAAIGRREELMG